MPSLSVLVPGSIATRTGGYEYDRRIVEGLRERGWNVDVRELDSSFPFPTDDASEQAARVLAAIADGATVLVDGLAFGAMPDLAEAHASRLTLVALVHHPLAKETGLDAVVREALVASERRALASVRGVVVTSERTAAGLAEYGVHRDRVTVVEPGTDPAPLARGSGGPEVSLLSLATVTPRKGYDVLVSALARLRHLQWRLVCLGSLDRDPEYARQVRSLVDAARLADRVVFGGEADADAVREAYDRADLFVLPTRYEGYGMVVAEALAHGLPVIATATGAIPALVVDGSGVVVEPEDVEALTRALEQAIGVPRALADMAAGARLVRERLPTWSAASGRMADALTRLASGGRL